jgi:hypothetical protein
MTTIEISGSRNERAVFVAEDGRRARRLRYVAAAGVLLSCVWLIGLGIGMLGLGKLPGVSLSIPDVRAESGQKDRSADIVGSLSESNRTVAATVPVAEPALVRPREPGSASLGAATRSRRQAAPAERRPFSENQAKPGGQIGPQEPVPAQPTPTPANRGWAQRGWTTAPGQSRQSRQSSPKAPTEPTRRRGEPKATAPTAPIAPVPPPLPPGQQKKADELKSKA